MENHTRGFFVIQFNEPLKLNVRCSFHDPDWLLIEYMPSQKEKTMAHAEGKITIKSPVATVFDFILDGANNRLWRPSVTDVTALTGKPYGVGSAFKQGLKGPGGRIDGDYKITDCRPNEFIEFIVTAGPARPTGTYRFEADGAATTVTFTLDFQPKGLAKLMEPMINQSMKSEVATLSNLKSYLETQT
jgi:uncharacterized protein YndB with AHSA1/START domain